MTTTATAPVDALTEPQPSDPIPDLVELVINGNIGAEPFNRILDRVIPAAMKRLSELPESERERQVEEGRAEVERYRNSRAPVAASTERSGETAPAEGHLRGSSDAAQGTVVPGTRKPNREQIVTPDDDMDDDDRYFQDRRQRGWLQ